MLLFLSLQSAAVLEDCCCGCKVSVRVSMWSMGCTCDGDRVLCLANAKEMGGSCILIVP